MVSYTEALQDLSNKIDKLAGFQQRQDEILQAVNKTNGFVRAHGEALATHAQRIENLEEKQCVLSERIDKLSGKLWALSGGSGFLAAVATILQFLNL